MVRYWFSHSVTSLLFILSTALFSFGQLIGGTPAQLGPTCGPPTYNCTRADLLATTLPAAVPNVGGLTGMSTIVHDDLGNNNRIVRATDAVLNPGKANFEYVVAASGSGDETFFSRVVGGHYLFCVNDSGSQGYVMDLNASTMAVTKVYPALNVASGTMKVPANCNWGYASNKLFVLTSDGLLANYDFTDWLSGPQTTQPVQATTFNFVNSTCLGASYIPTWDTDAGHTKDDTLFGAAFSNQGVQGTGHQVVAYKVGSGCSVLNTQTGVVSGDWGSTGTIAAIAAAPFGVHNVKIFKSGTTAWMVVACQGGPNGAPCPGPTIGGNGNPYAWQIGTLNFISLGANNGGHFTEGYNTWINGFNSTPPQNQMRRLVSNPSVTTAILNTSQAPAGIAYPQDFHSGWANVDSNDTAPFLLTTIEGGTTSPGHATGQATCSGTTCTWVTGHQFNTTWTGLITIGGNDYTIATVSSVTSLTTTTSVTGGGTLLFTFKPFTPNATAWDYSVLSMDPTLGIVHRFTHLFKTGEDAHIFGGAFGIGSVSQDGKFFAFASDWAGSLGSKTGGSTCLSKTDCRTDVFIVELR